MKGYVKVELLLEVESGDLEDNVFMVEDWVVDEMNGCNIHKDIKVSEVSIDAINFTEGEDGKDMYM